MDGELRRVQFHSFDGAVGAANGHFGVVGGVGVLVIHFVFVPFHFRFSGLAVLPVFLSTLRQAQSLQRGRPTQPFQPLPVPDGIEAQRGIVRDVVTGAVIGYGLHQAGHNSTTKTTVTGGAE